ncbi:MAG TPA: amidohydrolase [Longimicrobiales bacterium]
MPPRGDDAGDAGERRLMGRRATGAGSADLVFTGGVVWTGVSGAPNATAIAVRDGRVLHVGSDAEVRGLAGPDTREIPLDGRLVVPGLADSHTHFLSGGFQLAGVDLRDAATPAEFTRRIAEFARTLPPGRWITGGNWDHERWSGGAMAAAGARDGAPDAPRRLPRREWIDAVTPGHPVFVSRLDAHMALANGLALELAGITRETPDPPGGTIVRDPETGEPTGILKDAAMARVARIIPEPDAAECDDALRRAQAHALARGVTRVTDMGTVADTGSWTHLETLRRARERGELAVRAEAFVPIRSWQRLRDFVAAEGTGDARLRWGGVKGFVDGSLGSGTAWFHQPYTDAPETAGLTVTDPAELRAWIGEADAAGLRIAVHAIGDRANDWLLDAFAEVAAENGARDRRFRIEHAQHLSREAIGRFRALGVIASMQPYHAMDDARWAERRIGAERARTAYAFRSLLDAGACLAFGSDWTVAPLDPLLGIYAAVTRRPLDGSRPEGWVPEQKITVEDALRAYTAGDAYARFLEDELGTLKPGKRADLVVLSEDILTIDPVRIPEVRVDVTVIEGEVVFEG